ncbi:hypothetical protein XAR_4418 [Xanthomonas citri pv. glycines str. 8ra]|nr:hypothetical protein XAR_4418 [Xanthomonas citri pv. glycines str. 8ra]
MSGSNHKWIGDWGSFQALTFANDRLKVRYRQYLRNQLHLSCTRHAEKSGMLIYPGTNHRIRLAIV